MLALRTAPAARVRAAAVRIVARGVLVLCALVVSNSVAPAQCVGDCDLDGAVRIAELVRAVDIALDQALPDTCLGYACSSPDNQIACLVQSVANALRGCPTPSATATAVATCTATWTFVPMPTWTPSATATTTRTCASPPSPPACAEGQGADCDDPRCLIGCRCGTATATPTPSGTCTPGANPAPGCGYEGATFTATPLCHASPIPWATETAPPSPTVSLATPTRPPFHTPTSCVSEPPDIYTVTQVQESAFRWHFEGGSRILVAPRGGLGAFRNCNPISVVTNGSGLFYFDVDLEPRVTNLVSICTAPAFCGTAFCQQRRIECGESSCVDFGDLAPIPRSELQCFPQPSPSIVPVLTQTLSATATATLTLPLATETAPPAPTITPATPSPSRRPTASETPTSCVSDPPNIRTVAQVAEHPFRWHVEGWSRILLYGRGSIYAFPNCSDAVSVIRGGGEQEFAFEVDLEPRGPNLVNVCTSPSRCGSAHCRQRLIECGDSACVDRGDVRTVARSELQCDPHSNTPSSTPTVPPTATPTPEAIISALDEVVADQCMWNCPGAFYRYVYAHDRDYAIHCECVAGHSSYGELVRHASSADAAAAFAAATSGRPSKAFHDLPAAYWVIPNHTITDDGRDRYLVWQLGCWVITAHSFDDTHFEIAADPVAVSDAIFLAAGEELLSECDEH